MKEDLISVCVCTYRRPALLARLLNALKCQDIDPGFRFEVVVVDNDCNRSAEDTVRMFQLQTEVRVIYECEPEQNISLARNRTIQNAEGNFIAFIDDDEFPCENWLLLLYRLLKQGEVDGVLGPVIPVYEGTPPVWLVKSGLCSRNSFPSGTILRNPKYFRTGNVLFRRDIIEGDQSAFDPRFGRSGGEDTDFFKRMLCNGRSFVWCNEALVYETVPIERQKISYFLKRALVLGRTAALQEKFISVGTLKSIVALIAYTVSLPVLLVIKYHFFIKYLYKLFNHLSKLLAHFKIKLVNERTF